MDLSSGLVFLVVGLLGVNQLVMRVDALWRRDVIFFGLCIIHLFVGTWVMMYGVPGFSSMPIVSWVLGLLLFVHVAQNQSLRARRLAADAEDEALVERREEIRAGLRGSDGEAP